MRCPECDFEQPDLAVECGRCGIIFAKYRGDAPPPPPVPPAQPSLAMAGPAGTATSPAPVDGSTARLSRPRGFAAGGVVSETFRLFFSNLLSFLLISATVLLPMLALQLLVTDGGSNMSAGPQLLGSLIGMIGGQLATATLIYAVLQALRGRDPQLIESLATGLRSLVPVILIAILQGLAVGIGFMLLIVPGLIVATTLAVTVPAAIEERTGVSGAFSRSAELTRGYRWPVFAVLVVMGLVNLGLGLILILAELDDSPLFPILNGMVTVVSVTLSATASAVMYYRLRSVKESVDLEDLASVFD